MPSNRFTKINIANDTNELVKQLAAAQGVSATKLLDTIVLEYVRKLK